MDPELQRMIEELHTAVKALKEREAAMVWQTEAAITEALKPMQERVEELQSAVDEAKVAALRVPQVEGSRVEDFETTEARTGGFASLGDFVCTLVTNAADPRLAKLQRRALSMGVGTAGGFLVPPQFAAMLQAIQPQDAIVRPRATVIPAGTPPDAPITMPVLNQSGANGVYAGVQVTWIGEAATKPDTEPDFLQITLTPHEIAASMEITDKLIRNAAGVTSIVEKLLRGAIIAAEDVAFIAGTGIGQPLGFLGHASSINVVRAGAGAIAYADITNMYSQILLGVGQPVWIGNPTVLPQLQGMASPLGQLVWQPSAREGEPNSLMGIPFLRNQRQPVLGANGDLMLVNLGYYVIKDGSPLTVTDDGGILRFKYNTTTIKAFWNVDGQPWLTTPLLREDGATQASPFVVLL